MFEKHSGDDTMNQLIQVATHSFAFARLPQFRDITNINTLECVGKIRFVLHQYIEWIDKKYFTNADKDVRIPEQHENFKKIISDLCLETSFNTLTYGPQVFLLKLHFRRYGETAMPNISETSLHFVFPPGLDIRTIVSEIIMLLTCIIKFLYIFLIAIITKMIVIILVTTTAIL